MPDPADCRRAGGARDGGRRPALGGFPERAASLGYGALCPATVSAPLLSLLGHGQ